MIRDKWSATFSIDQKVSPKRSTSEEFRRRVSDVDDTEARGKPLGMSPRRGYGDVQCLNLSLHNSMRIIHSS
jgi:hypothetical protein